MAHVFVRYPDVEQAAQTARGFLGASAPAPGEVPFHCLVRTGGPWIGIYARGNSASPALAQHLSRALEAEALWFGLAGRSLAYRIHRYRHGRRIEERTDPADLFGEGGPRPMPAYPDAEQEVFGWLDRSGVPAAYRFLHAEELGAQASGTPDAVMIKPASGGLEEHPFAHRPPARPGSGIRSMFDRFDEEQSIVEDEIVVRGGFDPERARGLFATLQRILARRTVPEGWTFRYVLESPEGAALLDPLFALYAEERRAGRCSLDVTRA